MHDEEKKKRERNINLEEIESTVHVRN